jgi:toxin FitB
MKYLLDTCLLSELFRPQPNPGVLRWLDEQVEDDLALSVVTLGEVEKGAAKLSDPNRQARIRAWLSRDLRERFEGRTLAIDCHVALAWGTMTGDTATRGETLPVIGALIAATAVHHSLTVISRNEKDFERCGVGVFSPWTE